MEGQSRVVECFIPGGTVSAGARRVLITRGDMRNLEWASRAINALHDSVTDITVGKKTPIACEELTRVPTQLRVLQILAGDFIYRTWIGLSPQQAPREDSGSGAHLRCRIGKPGGAGLGIAQSK